MAEDGNMAEKAKELIRLSSLATPGEWRTTEIVGSFPTTTYILIESYDDREICTREYKDAWKNTKHAWIPPNMDFIAYARNHAPQIAQELVKALEFIEAISSDPLDDPQSHESLADGYVEIVNNAKDFLAKLKGVNK